MSQRAEFALLMQAISEHSKSVFNEHVQSSVTAEAGKEYEIALNRTGEYIRKAVTDRMAEWRSVQKITACEIVRDDRPGTTADAPNDILLYFQDGTSGLLSDVLPSTLRFAPKCIPQKIARALLLEEERDAVAQVSSTSEPPLTTIEGASANTKSCCVIM
jgi:hypothetical protein